MLLSLLLLQSLLLFLFLHLLHLLILLILFILFLLRDLTMMLLLPFLPFLILLLLHSFSLMLPLPWLPSPLLHFFLLSLFLLVVHLFFFELISLLHFSIVLLLELFSLLSLSFGNVFIECVTVFGDVKFFVVVNRDGDYLVTDYFFIGAAELGYVGVLKGLFDCEAFCRVEYYQFLNQVQALLISLCKKTSKAFLSRNIHWIQNISAVLRINWHYILLIWGS